MKAILMSIKPKWVAKILNGKKTIEIRKKFPKDYVGWVYIYCTKDKEYANLINRGGFLTGMVVARFWCDKVEEILFDLAEKEWFTDTLEEKELLKESCLSQEELDDYLQAKNGYAIHITKLEIFDKPKEISEFKCWTKNFDCEQCTNPDKMNDDCDWWGIKCPSKCLLPLTRAPQNYCYIEL